MSIEGGREETDERRGKGVYEKLISNMDALHDKELLFGISVTVTTRNVREVISHEFLDMLAERSPARFLRIRTSMCVIPP